MKQRESQEIIRFFMEGLTAYIEAHCIQDLDVRSIARLFGIKESRLYYLFRKFSDMGPAGYQQTCRLKQAAALLTLMMLTVILSGCGKQSPGNTPAVTQEDRSSSSSDLRSRNTQITDTKTYIDLAGRTVDIPVQPERIVAVNMAGELIALGITPVAVSDGWLQYLDNEQKKNIESIGAVGSLNLEKIVELDPDLIITPQKVTADETLAALEKIAPTVVGPLFGDALNNLRMMGDVVGRSYEAEAWLEEFEFNLKAINETLASVVNNGETAMVIQFTQKNMYTYPVSTFPVVYEYLGLSVPSKDISELTKSMQLSLEVLPEYDPDYIFVTKVTDEDDGYIQAIFENSVWKQLRAIQNGHVYVLGSRLSSGDVLSVKWSLEEIQRLMAAE